MPSVSVTPGEIEAAKSTAARNKGTGSFFLDIFGSPLMKRHPALSETVARYRRGLTDADVRGGEAVAKAAPATSKLLSEEIKTPVKTMGNLEVSHVAKVHRLTAPLAKAQKFLVPIFAYEGLRRIMAGKDHGKEAGERTMMTREEQGTMLKAAALIEQLGSEREILIETVAKLQHEKQAMKLAADMAGKGLIAQEDVATKAAELAREEDLGIVKKAVDLSERGFDMGRVEKTAGAEGEMPEDSDPMTDYLTAFVKGR